MVRSFSIVIILAAVTAAAAAQPSLVQSYRYEKEIKNSDYHYTLIPLETQGIVLLRDNERFMSGNRIWEVTRLDTALREVWYKEVEVDNKYRMIGFEVSPTFVFMLFREGESERSDFYLVRLSLEGTFEERYTITFDVSFRITHFISVGENIALGGYVVNQPTVAVYSIADKSLRIIPGFFHTDSDLVDVRANRNNSFNVVVIHTELNENVEMAVRTFDDQGRVLVEDRIPLSRDIKILTGMASTLARDELIVVGTYGARNSKLSSGMYSLTVDPFSDQTIHYYPFSQMDHFLDYMKPRKAQKIRNRDARNLLTGRELSYKVHVAPVRIHESELGFDLMAEVYYPMSTSTFSPGDYYSNPYYPYGNWSRGYNPYLNRYYPRPYTYSPTSTIASSTVRVWEAAVLRLDGSGKFVEDVSLPMEDHRIEDLEQVSDFVRRNDSLTLAYKKEENITVRFWRPALEEPVTETVKSRPSGSLESVRSEDKEDSGIRFWFGSSLYVWGYQNIRDFAQDAEKQNRYVFYVSRLDAR
jgi:hypothetical protein